VWFFGNLEQTTGGLQQQAELLELIFLVTPVTQTHAARAQTIVNQAPVALAQTIAHTAQLVVLAQLRTLTTPENTMLVALQKILVKKVHRAVPHLTLVHTTHVALV
jgi:hypothetical protein